LRAIKSSRTALEGSAIGDQNKKGKGEGRNGPYLQDQGELRTKGNFFQRKMGLKFDDPEARQTRKRRARKKKYEGREQPAYPPKLRAAPVNVEQKKQRRRGP